MGFSEPRFFDIHNRSHPLTDAELIEEVYELAFGENAINRNFSHEEVLEELTIFSENALKYEEGEDYLDSMSEGKE
tara:strand:- start:268 stop:495 length:228 start_codon:yes stop_codon:yes gene_type:complete